MIIIRGREAIIPQAERQIGTTYDGNSENRQFQVRRLTPGGVDLSGLIFKLNLQYADNDLDTCLLDKVVEDDFVILNWEIPSSCVSRAGTVWASIRGLDSFGTVKWATNRCAFYVEPVVPTPGKPEHLTEFEQLEKRIEEKTQTLDANETNRQEAEKIRVTNEEKRLANEALWQQQAEEAIKKAGETLTAAGKSAKDAQTAKTGAETAKSDALTYANKSKRYAIGGVEEGDLNDNAKYYCEEARKAAEQAAGNASFDGTADTVKATDTQGLVGSKGGKTVVQRLLDKIAEIIVNKVVTTDTFQAQLGKYLVNNGLATVAGKTALDAAYGKILADQVTKLNSDLGTINTKMKSNYITSGTILDWYIAHKDDLSVAFVVGSFIPSDVPESMEGFINAYRLIDENGNRGIIEFIPYNMVFTYRYMRTVINDNWLSDWVKINHG